VIALIPARGGSKGIPKKNLATVGGIPLVSRAIREAQRCCGRVIVSTDDFNIWEVAKDERAETITRPRTLATDETSILDVVIHARDEMKLKGELLVLLPTYPFRTVADIEDMKTLFTIHSKADSGLCGVPAWQHPTLMLAPKKDRTATPIFPKIIYRRQNRQPVFAICHYVAIVRCEKLELLDDGLRNSTTVFRYYDFPPMDIDTKEDLIMANNAAKGEI